jgi:hypothetical protein
MARVWQSQTVASHHAQLRRAMWSVSQRMYKSLIQTGTTRIIRDSDAPVPSVNGKGPEVRRLPAAETPPDTLYEIQGHSLHSTGTRLVSCFACYKYICIV